MFAEVFFDGAPEEFKEVELAVVFREEKASVPEPFNGFLDKGFLLQEVGLTAEDRSSTTKIRSITGPGIAFHSEGSAKKTALFEDRLHPFGLAVR
jgi:hypothetical protein